MSSSSNPINAPPAPAHDDFSPRHSPPVTCGNFAPGLQKLYPAANRAVYDRQPTPQDALDYLRDLGIPNHTVTVSNMALYILFPESKQRLVISTTGVVSLYGPPSASTPENDLRTIDGIQYATMAYMSTRDFRGAMRKIQPSIVACGKGTNSE